MPVPAAATMPGDRFLPHPEEDWYDRDIGTTGGGLEHVFWATPAQRRSYVRYILAGHGGERSWELRELVDWEPESLAPWADAVTTFDSVAIDHLSDVEWPDYWLAAYHASDPAVDALAARIADGPPGRTSPPGDKRVHLLAGVDTDHALARLADLARARPELREIAAGHGIWVPPEGPGVRRYVRPLRLILSEHPEPEPGLRVDPPAGDVLADPRGTGCARPLSIVLDVDLSLLGLAPAGTRRHPFIGSLCSQCEADEEMATFRSWTTVDGKLVLDDERDERCPGNDDSGHAWTNPVRLGLGRGNRYQPYDPDVPRQPKPVGWLGGLPEFRQHPFWPECCDKPMVYVGQANQGVLGGFSQYLYGFACECGAGAQVGQHT
ncbi:hypothetical protein GCM10009557_09740 [Virgisporangium ochraceum]|uniref:Uncharacterized protein n=1 Tax=Virgisporangium ochraceum TaxID=65505 RepID=A0A8J3ZYU3_9ACTN|nr:hypothetical protein [Virgisporangium ochraceum]GIJ71377.1 hypothetical protein Voc01_062940 [Virgisporangium ochraceum]